MNRSGYKEDFDKHIGLYSDPLDVGNGDFIFTVQGHNSFWMHIYLGKQNIHDADGYTDLQLLILNHPTIGIYHDYDILNHEHGLDVQIIGVDLI